MWWRRKGKPENPDEPTVERPAAEDFTPEAIAKAVLAETAQHPATVFPAAVGAIAGLWGLAFGFTLNTLAAVFGCGFVSVASWIVNYFFRGDAFAELHVERLRAQRAQSEARESRDLEARCRKLGFTAGAKAAADLRTAYQRLREFLAKRENESDNPSVVRFQMLAEETHQEGLGLLRRGCEMYEALKAVNAAGLDRELQQWKLQRAKTAGEAAELLDQKIAANEEQIKSFRAGRRRLDQILAELNKMQVTLQSAHLETTDLVGDDRVGSPDRSEALAQLEASIEAARRVDQWLNPDDDASDDEQKYLDAAEKIEREKNRSG